MLLPTPSKPEGEACAGTTALVTMAGANTTAVTSSSARNNSSLNRLGVVGKVEKHSA